MNIAQDGKVNYRKSALGKDGRFRQCRFCHRKQSKYNNMARCAIVGINVSDGCVCDKYFNPYLRKCV